MTPVRWEAVGLDPSATTTTGMASVRLTPVGYFKGYDELPEAEQRKKWDAMQESLTHMTNPKNAERMEYYNTRPKFLEEWGAKAEWVGGRIQNQLESKTE